jgi:hypothetical protein
LTDDRKEIARHDDRLAPGDARNTRRPYAAPELVEYGTVAKLTQGNSGSLSDFGGTMAMKICL